MSENKEKRKLTVFVEEELHSRLRIRAAPRDLSFQQFAVEALELWAQSPDPPTVSPQLPGLTEEDSELAIKLLKWFKSNRNQTQQDVVEIVRRALERM